MNLDNYDDIINMDRPASKRQKMPIDDRAKIFAPFAALRGFDDAIEDTAGEHIENENHEDIEPADD